MVSRGANPGGDGGLSLNFFGVLGTFYITFNRERLPTSQTGFASLVVSAHGPGGGRGPVGPSLYVKELLQHNYLPAPLFKNIAYKLMTY